MGVAAAVLLLAALQAYPAEDKRGFTLFDPTPTRLLRPLTTDRPDVTESPITVDAGHLQVELSLAEYGARSDAGSRTRSLAVLPVNLKLGLLDNVDLQLVLTPYQRTEARGGGERLIAAGSAADTQVRLKINLWGNDGGPTALAIMPFVKAPTGPRRLTNGQVEGGVIVPLAIALPRGFSLGVMAEFDVVAGEGRSGYGIDVVHSATLGHALVGPLAGYVEYVGVAPRRGGGGYRALASAGLTYALGAGWAIDGGGTLGLTGDVDDVTVFVGTSFRF